MDHSRGGGDGIEGGFVDVQSSDEDLQYIAWAVKQSLTDLR